MLQEHRLAHARPPTEDEDCTRPATRGSQKPIEGVELRHPVDESSPCDGPRHKLSRIRRTTLPGLTFTGHTPLKSGHPVWALVRFKFPGQSGTRPLGLTPRCSLSSKPGRNAMAAADQPVCARHGRPAVASRVRVNPDGTQEVEYLCEIDLAEEQMSSRFGSRSGSLFDDFFSDFFGDGGSSAGRAARRTAAPQRQVERVDVTQFFSDATRDLLQRGAQTAVEWGSLDLDSEHLLYAALQDDVVRHVLQQIDADPEAIAAEIEDEADKASRTDVSPSLSPDAKAALLAAYDESRELGSSYVGPEHVLLALARDNDSEAGRLLERFGASHTKLRGGVIRGVEPTGGAREMSRTPS